MKQYWRRIVLRIDALTVRERALIFAAAAAAVITLVNVGVLDREFARQKQLSEQLKLEQGQIKAIQTEVQEVLKASQVDPDAAEQLRLSTLKQQAVKMHAALQDMQKGLVSPDKMSGLLEDILRRDGRLKLVSLRTLAPSGLVDAGPGEKTVGAQSALGSVYKHGVEIVVQGGYLDMMHYMAELEKMPWQLFWGKARVEVGEYPRATLTLTLFTLSLDKKWLNL